MDADGLNTPLHSSPIDASVAVWGFVVMPSNTYYVVQLGMTLVILRLEESLTIEPQLLL